jgi:hypothetical protein
MTSSEFQPEEMLDMALEALGEVSGTVEDNAVDTTTALVRLAKSWREEISEDDKSDLNAICKKIHISSKVRAFYKRGWRPDKQAEPLPPESWALLIADLLAYSIPQDSEEESKGFALKNLNAAFAALDLADKIKSVEHLQKLKAWAEHLLETSFQGEG